LRGNRETISQEDKKAQGPPKRTRQYGTGEKRMGKKRRSVYGGRIVTSVRGDEVQVNDVTSKGWEKLSRREMGYRRWKILIELGTDELERLLSSVVHTGSGLLR